MIRNVDNKHKFFPQIRNGMLVGVQLYDDRYFAYMKQVDLEGKVLDREKFLSFKEALESIFMVIRTERLPNAIDLLWSDGVWRMFLRADININPIKIDKMIVD